MSLLAYMPVSPRTVGGSLGRLRQRTQKPSSRGRNWGGHEGLGRVFGILNGKGLRVGDCGYTSAERMKSGEELWNGRNGSF